jgi:DNA-binding PadR family transcriptional regulator
MAAKKAKVKNTPARRRAPAEGEMIRLTALQLAILVSIESGPRREQYGAPIIQDVARDLKLTGLPLATVYTALRRLEQRGFLTSRWGAPGPDGGNRRRFYRATSAASKTLKIMAVALQPAAGRARR